MDPGVARSSFTKDCKAQMGPTPGGLDTHTPDQDQN